MDLEREIENALKLHRETMDLWPDVQKTGANILQELARGLTFASLARDSLVRGHPEDSERQKALAREAHQAVVKLLGKTIPTAQQNRRIEADLAELDSKLKTLGVT
jgi:hypothetical protein